MTARLLIGDVFDRMAELKTGSVDFLLTSPPFLKLRSYLPTDHPDKAKEIGSEGSPAEWLDVMLRLTAEWGRLLAPHGSIAVELGDTYSGKNGGGGWPLAKSLCGIPTLYAWSLAYGRNLLTGEESPAGMWRVRNLKPWIRSNPPVGALGDKERPATSYIVVATRARDRWFDLDAVRTPFAPGNERPNPERRNGDKARAATEEVANKLTVRTNTHTGAPPLDWFHEVDAVLNACLDKMANQTRRRHTVSRSHHDPEAGQPQVTNGVVGPVGARGVHLRRALEAAGILTTPDAIDITTRGYKGAHYAVWPPELCRRLIEEMCPRSVCRICGEASRRITAIKYVDEPSRSLRDDDARRYGSIDGKRHNDHRATQHDTLGWSTCTCPGTSTLSLDGFHTGPRWRPGLVLDPFVGSCTTLLVASDLRRDSIGIDIDPTSVDHARHRGVPLDDIDTNQGIAS